MIGVSDFSEVLEKAVVCYYDLMTDNDNLMKELANCKDESEIDDILFEWRVSDSGCELLDNAADNTMMYYSSMWSVIMTYITDPSDIIQNAVDGLDIYSQFEDDVFDETRKRIHESIDKIRRQVQENED